FLHCSTAAHQWGASVSTLYRDINSLTLQTESLGQVRKIFGMAGEQQAAGLQRRGEAFENAGLHGLVEINHGVAAKNHVELLSCRPARIEQVQRIELDHVAQNRLDTHHAITRTR